MNAAEIFLEESRYYLCNEYLSKLRQCIDALPEDAVWRRSNNSSNSIGNLLLHLAGNVREWILGGIGGQRVDRDRAQEFSARDGGPAAQLIADLERTLSECDAVLASLTASDLACECTIQGTETTVLGAIYHVVEHFSMHTGQIIMLTKEFSPNAIHFYDDSTPAARPLWGGSDEIRA